ncbi:uncharacterized protein LOC135698504 [Ochlerotatus camptorhynchus]|uniref:uncharacterized protein LOC135698504 n=1 Tax=Ochlerotatus camptorhynchus TaxID=644619 RepID=UPI0031D01375
MKRLIFILALFGATLAQSSRQSATDVIRKFKEVAPKYLEILEAGETELEQLRVERSDMVAKFHDDIIIIKESYVVDAIKKEISMHQQITGQPFSVDVTCLKFVNTTLDMNMDLAGAGFTNCINNVDEAFNGMVAKYLNAIGVQETMLNELRLLDVFRGDNVFYTPQNIIDKLDSKLADLKFNPESMNEDLKKAKETFKNDLEKIRSDYVGCMTQGEQLLSDGITLLNMQLTFSCLGKLI